MTAKQVYEYLLIELNKNKAPAVLLEDFIYYLNKGIQHYVNFKYNLYDTSQQIDDDLKEIIKLNYPIELSLQDGSYKGTLPVDYLHSLTGKVKLSVLGNLGCYKEGDIIESPINRMPKKANYSTLNNYYFKPSHRQPYQNIYGNTIEVKAGNKVTPLTIYIDYIKKPIYVILTEEQIEDVIDTSQVLEFSEYVCLEIINEVVKLLMEHSSDQRLQTNIPVNQTIFPMGASFKK